MYGLTAVTAPVEEPLSVASAKDWLRVEGSDEDTRITGLVTGVRVFCEQQYGLQFVTSTWRLTLDCFPWWGVRIPRPPLLSVVSVQYLDSDGDLQTLGTSVYEVDTSRRPGVLSLAYGQVWPVTRPSPSAVRINFTAGYGSASAVPEHLKLALKLAVAAWYFHPGDEADRTLPAGTQSILAAECDGYLEHGEVEP